MLAAQCDRDRGIARTRSMPTLVAAAQAIQRYFHFGPGNSLYGVLTQPGTDAPLAR